ncbi:uncharacterized protein PRCAT00003875001 [Priceomyces carsonii]|uniref:uncharacterized protein n=1 Tax=Priceomyces carsonii TaxID=28549 RepID=UPI002EDB7A15|nr:unnamed protein product [Priceomyces carsonii]
MITKKVVSLDDLFLILPSDLSIQPSLVDLEEALKSTSTGRDRIIDLTWHLIQNQELSLDETLKLWEIRLTLLLFNSQLNIAKKEAINLNNALYLSEDDSNSTSSSTNSLMPIYPLPKNNDKILDYNLLTLLIRLKSIPNLNLVNEIYKLTYQLRLKYKGNLIYKKLINLSYDVMVILIINKNYLTLINLLGSIIHELEIYPERDHNNYHSNVLLVYIIVKAYMFQDVSQLVSECKETFSGVNRLSKMALYFVLKSISPRLTFPNEKETMAILPPSEDFSIDYLATAVSKGDISTRIICSAMGMWDLINRFDFQLLSDPDISFTDPHLTQEYEGDMSVVESCYRLVNTQWAGQFQKVYGLE